MIGGLVTKFEARLIKPASFMYKLHFKLEYVLVNLIKQVCLPCN